MGEFRLVNYTWRAGFLKKEGCGDFLSMTGKGELFHCSGSLCLSGDGAR